MAKAASTPVLPSLSGTQLANRATEKSLERAHEIMRMTPETDPMVKGIFRNIETPGGSLKVSTRFYKGQKIKSYELEDGKEYEIPLSLAKHLNNQCSYPLHSHLMDASGNPIIGVGKWINRYEFRSLDYI